MPNSWNINVCCAICFQFCEIWCIRPRTWCLCNETWPCSRNTILVVRSRFLLPKMWFLSRDLEFVIRDVWIIISGFVRVFFARNVFFGANNDFAPLRSVLCFYRAKHVLRNIFFLTECTIFISTNVGHFSWFFSLRFFFGGRSKVQSASCMPWTGPFWAHNPREKHWNKKRVSQSTWMGRWHFVVCSGRFFAPFAFGRQKCVGRWGCPTCLVHTLVWDACKVCTIKDDWPQTHCHRPFVAQGFCIHEFARLEHVNATLCCQYERPINQTYGLTHLAHEVPSRTYPSSLSRKLLTNPNWLFRLASTICQV